MEPGIVKHQNRREKESTGQGRSPKIRIPEWRGTTPTKNKRKKTKFRPTKVLMQMNNLLLQIGPRPIPGRAKETKLEQTGRNRAD